jgi:hypothetical protein
VAFNKKKILFTGKLDLKKLDQKYLGSFEMWCWRRMENIIWTNYVRDEEVLQRVKEDGNILQTIKIRKAKWIGHILHRNCLLKHVIEGKVGVRSYWLTLRKRKGTGN